jgi:hypothetical protein
MAHRCLRKEDQVKCCVIVGTTKRSICNDGDVTAAVVFVIVVVIVVVVVMAKTD